MTGLWQSAARRPVMRERRGGVGDVMVRTLSLAAMAVALSSSLHAQTASFTRTWVSGKGVNQAGCGPIQTPCRTLQYAHDSTIAGGEIDVLDSAGYGSIVISKSISIVGDGSIAGVLASSGGTGISLLGNDTDIVTLRGLTIEGAGVGSTGIDVSHVKALTVINCAISNFTTAGLMYVPRGTSTLTVSNSTITDIGGVGLYHSGQGGGTQRFSIDRSLFSNNKTSAIQVDDDVVKGAITETIVQHNFGYGLYNGTGTVVVRGSTFANNATGIYAKSSGTNVTPQIWVGSSTVSGNGTGVAAVSPAVVYSYGNNFIEDNAAGNTAPPSAQQK